MTQQIQIHHTNSTPKALTLWRGLVCVLMTVLVFFTAFFGELYRVPKGLLLKAITRRLITFILFATTQIISLFGCVIYLIWFLIGELFFIIFALLIWHPLLLATTLFTAAQRGQLWLTTYRISKVFALWVTKPVRCIIQQVKIIRLVIRSRQTERLLLKAYGQKSQKVKSYELCTRSIQSKTEPAQEPLLIKPALPVWPTSNKLTKKLIASALSPLWSLFKLPYQCLNQTINKTDQLTTKNTPWFANDPPAQAPPPVKMANLIPPILAPPILTPA